MFNKPVDYFNNVKQMHVACKMIKTFPQKYL